MPILIDEIQTKDATQCYYRGLWFVAKPLNPHPRKLWNAWLVLTGRAFAVEYAEDRVQREPDFIARDSAKADEGK